jgi:2-methylaconitate cis-trans-isomerase PrpF
MSQYPVPALFIRGGTSRGPYFRREDLPEDREALSKVLIAAVGSGHPLCIDGIGGSAAVTTKTVMLSKGTDGWADVDYFFAQVQVEEREVDFSPTCGNMLAGVGPAAIEMGIVPAADGETRVRIHAVNTGARVEAVVKTPGGVVDYAGEARIDGVPGTAAPIILNFMDVVGSKTAGMFPTGRAIDTVQGREVTSIDVAMPLVIGRARDFGITGYETREALDANEDLKAAMESVRIEAGRMMGLGDVTRSVIPKFALLAEPREGGAIAARYFMPWQCHPSMAVSGAICIGSCVMAPGTVADGLARIPNGHPVPIGIEHPMGRIDVAMDAARTADGLDLRAAGVLRTARLLMRGEVMIPAADWPG